MDTIKYPTIDVKEIYEKLKSDYYDHLFAAAKHYDAGETELGNEETLKANKLKTQMSVYEDEIAKLEGQPQPGNNDE